VPVTRGPSASVVVATYAERRWADLRRAVRSLSEQSVAPLEVIVVVDHNPALLHRVRAGLPGVVAIASGGDRGLAAARNAGLHAARGDVVAFMDDDAEAHREWARTLLAGYAEPGVAGVGGAVEPRWPAGRPRWFPPELDWVVGCTYRGLPTGTRPVRNLIGCNMSFRRDALLELGGFRSGLGRVGTAPLGCEETELCIRLLRRWPERVLLYEPRARVSHRVSGDRGRWRYLASRCYAEGLSKARVSRTVGRRDALSSEWRYVVRTLPPAFGRGLADFALRARPGGLQRSTAIAAGLILTTVGYCRGRLTPG
jgi:glycosyltransferase involved in cell wall biosynthesis